MRKDLLVTAAALAGGLIAGSAGAASANAATGSEDLFCATGYSTCLTWLYTKYESTSRPHLTVDVYINPYTANQLETSYDWTSPTFTNAGTYTVSGKAEPVSDINLGAPAPVGNRLDEFTCLRSTCTMRHLSIQRKRPRRSLAADPGPRLRWHRGRV